VSSIALERVVHRPADDAPARQIEHDGEIEKALLRGHIRQVAHPRRIARPRADRKIARQEIGCDGLRVIGVGGADKAPAPARHEALLAHEAGDALLARVLAARGEFVVEARRAVAPLRLAEH
jgi:hypothetical protein